MSNHSAKSKYIVLRKFDKYLSTLEAILAGIFYSAMVVIVFAGVIMRYFLKIPNLYGEEVSRYLMVACIFIGVAVACRRKMHMNVEMFVNAFPKPVGHAIKFVVHIIVIGIYIFMTYQGIMMVMQMQTFAQTSPAMRMPMWIMYAIITLGFALSALTEILLFIDTFVFKGELLDDVGQEGQEI